MHGDPALGRQGDSGKQLEQSAFSGTVSPDDAEDLSLMELERDISHGPELLWSRGSRVWGIPGSPAKTTQWGSHGPQKHLLEGRPIRTDT